MGDILQMLAQEGNDLLVDNLVPRALVPVFQHHLKICDTSPDEVASEY